MPRRTAKILPSAIGAFLGIGCMAAIAGPEPAQSPAMIMPAAFNRPVGLTLEARSVERDAAFGAHAVTPIFRRAAFAVLAEAYGYKGEGQLGLAGAGVIARRAVNDHSSVEASVFFEGLRATDGFSYPQLGAGLAYSPTRWLTLRTNGYLPLSGKDSCVVDRDHGRVKEGSGANRREVDYDRSIRDERAPMRGFDAEAEFRLPQPPRWVDPRVAVGYAYREAMGRPEVYAGPTVRGELRFARHWIAEAEWREDAHGIGQEWRVGLRFEMLFGAPGREEGRAAEAFAPVQRFPWPTVARGTVQGKAERGRERALSAPAQPEEPTDCCSSGTAPLEYE